MKTILRLLFLFTVGAPAFGQTTNSIYSGVDGGNWSGPMNWSPMVVPNNGGGMTFNVALNGAAVQLDLDVVVTNLDLNAGGGSVLIDNTHQLTAANTTIGDGSFQLIGTGIVDLGNLADFSDHTLNSGDLRIDANTPGQIAKLKFNGADIVENFGLIRFTGADARMEDENGNSVFRNLALNGNGALIRLGYGSNLSSSADFHNAGTFILRQGSTATFSGGYTSDAGDGDDGLLEFYGTDNAARSGDGNVIVTGSFGNQDANGKFSGKYFLWSYGTGRTTLQYNDANIIDVTADQFYLQGPNTRVVDQMGHDGLRNWAANHSQVSGTQIGARTVNISGNFDNEGVFGLVGDAHFKVAGNFTSNGFMFLDIFDLYQIVAFDGFPPSDAGVLSSELNVSGDLTFAEANEVQFVLFSPEVIDKTIVGGTATLGGLMDVIFAFDDSQIASSDIFTMLSSGHPIAGQFSNVASGERINAYFVDPDTVVPLDYPAGSFRVDYSGNNLTLSDYEHALPAELRNISTRVDVQTGDNVGIAGFIVTGSGEKQVLVRAVGPSLNVDGTLVPGRLGDTVLELRDSDGALLEMNDDWMMSPQAAAIENSGLAPKDTHESAILRSLIPGSYTAIMRGKHGTTGLGSIEVYETGASSAAHLGNLSTRGLVESGDNVLIGGLISGTPDTGLTTMIVRAIGPSLGARGVMNALQDPVLELHDGDGNLIAFNDSWKSDQQAEIEAYGLGLKDDREAALVVTAASGSRTVVVRGASETSGVALVEIYNVGTPVAVESKASSASRAHRPRRAPVRRSR